MDKREKNHSVESEKPRRVLARAIAEDVANSGRRGRYRTFTQDPDPGGYDLD